MLNVVDDICVVVLVAFAVDNRSSLFVRAFRFLFVGFIVHLPFCFTILVVFPILAHFLYTILVSYSCTLLVHYSCFLFLLRVSRFLAVIVSMFAAFSLQR